MDRIFRPTDILIPADGDMARWSVIACDQFSSQPGYWDALDEYVGDAPSTLRLMLPEAYLERRDPLAEARTINATMRRYLDGGVFRTLPGSFVYLERTLSDGTVRRGLMAALDLDQYDYNHASASPIRATEGTVPERLPPRVRVRRDAPLEMPHIMVLMDDKQDGILGSLSAKKAALPALYDFELNCGGGRLRGWQASGDDAAVLERAADAYVQAIREQYVGSAPAMLAIGDGNHSLAAAKNCWEEIKKSGLSPEQLARHPARFSLVELVNIHDDAIRFEPIHKVLFDTDAKGFFDAAKAFWAERGRASGEGHTLRLVAGGREESLAVGGLTIGQLIGAAEEFCQGYIAAHGGKVDYIHNDDTALEMGGRPGGAAVLLPTMKKDELFPSIIRSGPFPKKSFSIGHAEDKRYYLECRKIQTN